MQKGGFKMTLAIKQHKENGFYVLMEWDKTNVYHVEVCPCYDGKDAVIL